MHSIRSKKSMITWLYIQTRNPPGIYSHDTGWGLGPLGAVGEKVKHKWTGIFEGDINRYCSSVMNAGFTPNPNDSDFKMLQRVGFRSLRVHSRLEAVARSAGAALVIGSAALTVAQVKHLWVESTCDGVVTAAEWTRMGVELASMMFPAEAASDVVKALLSGKDNLLTVAETPGVVERAMFRDPDTVINDQTMKPDNGAQEQPAPDVVTTEACVDPSSDGAYVQETTEILPGIVEGVSYFLRSALGL
jgi:hypothetical protein